MIFLNSFLIVLKTIGTLLYLILGFIAVIVVCFIGIFVCLWEEIYWWVKERRWKWEQK